MVVHRMTDDLGPLNFTEAAGPVPDHTASMDEPAPETPTGTKRRLLPGAGSRDSGTRDSRRTTGPRERKPLPPIPRNGFAPDVTKFYMTMAMVTMPFDVELASKITEVAEPAGQAWDELARKNDVVRRALVALIETGAWGNLTMAHAPLFALAWARMTGESVRVTFAASQLGREAETHANRGHDGNTDGSP
jgi:hypothetical protein